MVGFRPTSMLRVWLVGLLAGGAVGLVPAGDALASGLIAEQSPPIIEHLEFDEAGIMSYTGLITPDSTTTDSRPELEGAALVGGQVQINDLFVRYIPGTGVADVFISLMLTGELGGCSSSMHTLNQTTDDPVPVDADGRATATIHADWMWDAQQLAGGVCFEKFVVAQWTETYSIELTFSDGSVGALVKYRDEVESLGLLTADRPPTAQITVTTVQPITTVPALEPDEGTTDSSADITATGDPEDATATAGDDPSGADEGLDTGSLSGPKLLLLVPLLLVMVAIVGWIGWAIMRRFVKRVPDFEKLADPIGTSLLAVGDGSAKDGAQKPVTARTPPPTVTEADALASDHVASVVLDLADTELVSGMFVGGVIPEPPAEGEQGWEWHRSKADRKVGIAPVDADILGSEVHVIRRGDWYQTNPEAPEHIILFDADGRVTTYGREVPVEISSRSPDDTSTESGQAE